MQSVIAIPHPKQQLFLDCEADIALFGGSAGSGKSLASLLDPLKYVDNPGFTGVILRRTYPELCNPGGLVDKSQEIYRQHKAEFKQSSLDWHFPSGARIGFRHMQHDKDVYNFQGSELAYISFDEATHFSDRQFWYLLSRNRSVSGIKPKIRLTCNPDAEHWLTDFVQWWIDVDGFPIADRSGVIRYFIRINDELQWADTAKELQDLFGDVHPKSFTFIPAALQDNPTLLEKNPEYLANLKALHPIDQARLLGGNWKIKSESGTVFNRTWFEIINTIPDGGTAYRFWDLAATARDVAKKSSFYTCGVKVKKVGAIFYVLDVVYDQISPATIADFIFAVANQDTTSVPIRWELEGGSAGLILEQVLKKRLTGWNCQGVKPKGDKVTRAIAAGTAASLGNVKLVRAAWNDAFLSAVQAFDGSPKPLTNDIVDAFDGAFDCAETGARQMGIRF